MRGLKQLGGLIAAGAIAFAAVGCGDGPTPEPTPVPTSAVALVTVEQFVEQVCAPWQTFYAEFERLQASFVGSNTSNEEHKRLLLEQTQAFERASRGLVEAIPFIGQPDQPGGAEVRQVFTDFFAQEQRTMQGYVEGVQKLDTSDDQKFADGIQAIVDGGEPNLTEQRLVDLNDRYPLAEAVVIAIDRRDDLCPKIFLAF